MEQTPAFIHFGSIICVILNPRMDHDSLDCSPSCWDTAEPLTSLADPELSQVIDAVVHASTND
jgi:hypothetical protein